MPHEHTEPPADPALRVKALESLLVEKGLVDPAALDTLIDTYEHKIGPQNGAKVVAKAWQTLATPSGYKTMPQRLSLLYILLAAKVSNAGRLQYANRTPPSGMHLVFLLPVAGIGLAAGLV